MATLRSSHNLIVFVQKLDKTATHAMVIWHSVDPYSVTQWSLALLLGLLRFGELAEVPPRIKTSTVNNCILFKFHGY